MDDLVSTAWLAAHLDEPGLVVIDASAHLPDAGRDAAEEFVAAHIPGAEFLELETFKDGESAVPAALPTAAQFARRMAERGVRDGDRVVIYDDSAVKTSARAWFILRMHGVRQVAILDGGLGKWRAEGRALEAGTRAAAQGKVTPASGPGKVRGKSEILTNISSRAEQLVDSRGTARFTGSDPEPRAGIASGHIPGSLSMPFGKVLNEDGTFKDEVGLRAAFAEAGVDLARPVTATCGSGVTAAVLLFALHLLGKQDTALYDGSWSEWGADPDTPKATGEAA